MRKDRALAQPAPEVGVSGDHVRLIVKVARMYHEHGMRQVDIAQTLHLSQARVSRLLKRASEVGVVRTTVTVPAGVHTDLEEALEQRFGLQEAVVVEASGSDEALLRPLGAAAAAYLEATLTGGEVIGLSSWSSTLLAAVEVMRPSRTRVVETVVQVVGGVGDQRVQMQANRLIATFAHCTGAEAVLMPAPGLLGTPAARQPLMDDPTVASVMKVWQDLSRVVVGIGSLEPSPLLRESGNAIAEVDQQLLRDSGAVGDVCLRFFDASGEPVLSSVDDRVVGISTQQLRDIPYRVAVAGGPRKHAAILAALRGSWVNVLITDTETAEFVLGA